MKYNFRQGILICLIACCIGCELHEAPKPVPELSKLTWSCGEPSGVVRTDAVPANGVTNWYAYIQKMVQYPGKTNIQGMVFVEFTVEKDGSLSNFTVIKGIGHGCDEEAVRVLQNSPKWVPATLQGQCVEQRVVFPVKFKWPKS